MEISIKSQIKESFEIKQKIFESNNDILKIQDIAVRVIQTYREGKKVWLAGNGGSAADAQHIAGEFVSKFYFDRPGLPAIALSTDTSILTSIGNDYGYEQIFARQLQANAAKGDLFIAISTSGNSQNILNALEYCKQEDIITVGLTGQNGGKMADLCDFCVRVPSDDTPRVQEAHIMIAHIICALVEEAIFKRGN